MFDSSVDSGAKQPLRHSTCRNTADCIHLLPMVRQINSLATILRHNRSGNVTKAVKRISLRKAASCLSPSPRRSTNTGCATWLTMPCTTEKAFVFHWEAWK